MLLQKIESAKWSAKFAKKREDVQDGDMVTILADVEVQPDNYNPGKFQTAVKVQTKNGERMIGLSQTSQNILIDEFGTNDAAKWVGKEAKVLLKPTTIGGKKVIAAYLVGTDWVLDEFGSPVKEGQSEPVDDIPVIQEDDGSHGDEINPSDIPF